jgi:hypothetical protein
LRADTFSHAHPTDEFGANPLTRNGAAEVTPPPAVESPAANVEGVPSANPEEWAQPAAPPTSAHRPDANEAYAATNASAPEQTHTTTTSPTDAEKSGHV